MRAMMAVGFIIFSAASAPAQEVPIPAPDCTVPTPPPECIAQFPWTPPKGGGGIANSEQEEFLKALRQQGLEFQNLDRLERNIRIPN